MADALMLGIASLLREAARNERLPPVTQWNPSYCGVIDIRIDHDGTWFHEGEAIRRPELVRLFSTILRRDGRDYFLVTPAEKLRIEVEDAPFLAVLLRTEGEGAAQLVNFTTNVGDECAADAEHPIRVANVAHHRPVPYLHVRDGLEARISRSVFYELAALAVPDADDPQCLGVWSGGLFFPLGRVE